MFYFSVFSRIWNDTFMHITHDTYRSIPPCNHVLVRFIYRLLAEYSLVWVRFNQGVTDSALNSETYNYFTYNVALKLSCRVGCGKFVRFTYFKIIQKLPYSPLLKISSMCNLNTASANLLKRLSLYITKTSVNRWPLKPTNNYENHGCMILYRFSPIFSFT